MIDLLIGHYIDCRFVEPACCRMPSDDPATVGLWIQRLRQAEGFKVVFIGDSVIHGLAGGREDQALPAAVAASLKKRLPGKKISVFNLALAGCGPSETYLVLNALATTKIELVVYDLNIGWFPRNKAMEHPNLLSLPFPTGFDPRKDGLDGPQEPLRGERWVTDALFSHWKLYHYRILLNYWLFGKPIRSKLPIAIHHPEVLLTNIDAIYPEIKEMRTNWRQKAWKKNTSKEAQLSKCKCNLTSNNTQWRYYCRTIDLLAKRDAKTVVFVPPRNFELLEETNKIDYLRYQHDTEQATTAARQHGITVFRYDRAVDSNHFNDEIHLDTDGNYILAERLVEDLVSKGLLKER